ncbi:recombinase XerD, partial [Leptospira stimsonii]
MVSFLKHCNTLKEKTIFVLLYSSGIRIGELEKLKIGDIDFE